MRAKSSSARCAPSAAASTRRRTPSVSGRSRRLVILPQLVRLALPGIANLWLVLLKDTSLVSVIALSDLLRETQVAVGATKQPFFFFLVACLVYLGMSIISSFGIIAIERWSERGTRRA